MRDLHEQMLTAVLDGDGLAGIAALAAREVGSPVAILLPERGIAATSSTVGASEPPEGLPGEGELSLWAAESLAGTNGLLPKGIELTVPVVAAGEEIGRVVALEVPEGRAGSTVSALIDREEVLRWAGLAALTELAVIEARDQLAEELRGSFIEDLRAAGLNGEEVVRRGKRLGCDLSGGVVAIAASASSGKPRYMAAIISSATSSVIAEPLGDRIFALIPATDQIGRPNAAQSNAREIVKRVRPHGPAAASSHYSDPADAGRALEEAELMLDVVGRDPRLAELLEGGIPSGVYRLLFRALASNPAEVMRFYKDTVEVLVSHDAEHKTDLLNTLEAYLARDCNMRVTAEAVYAHRHTVAHRLERIKELCGLDPSSGEDRERLGLGIKAYRLIEPTLPR